MPWHFFGVPHAARLASIPTPVKSLYVTQPFLPPLDELQPYLQSIWETKWLTNSGPFHEEFESRLASHLGLGHVALFVNGTLALVTAVQALKLSGEVITTPYSFVATAHALLWSGIKPVFVDIDEASLNIDPARIEAAITPDTSAILAVHTYGRPCDTAAIQRIADKHGLKVIYDAAHAFGVCDAGGSILRHGDLSILSFHATKVFHTFEGGAIVCGNAETKRHIDELKNFGFADEITVVSPGINGKMNEIQAAMGLVQLKHVQSAIEKRKALHARYCSMLRSVPGIVCPPSPERVVWNYAYFPILVRENYGASRDALYDYLKRHGVYGRRYFFPLISEFPMYRDLPSAARVGLPVAVRTAEDVLCLPIYPDLEQEDVERVVALIQACPARPRE